MGVGLGCGGCAKARVRSVQLCRWKQGPHAWKSRAACFQSPQAFFHTSKLLISKFKLSSSHSARNSVPRTELTTSSSTKGMSPDIVIRSCGCQAESYCTGGSDSTDYALAPVRPLRSSGGHVQSPDVAIGDSDILAFEQ